MKKILSNLHGDLFGGITAAVVALPLALAFGVASGIGPVAGLYGAIAVGFFAALFGGTPSQISGPTGPMTVVMGAVVAQFADRLEIAFAIVFLGGLIQVLFGVLRVGRYVSYTPYSVISGFMSGIGVIIIIIEILPFLGLGAVPGGPVGTLSALPTALPGLQIDAVLISLISLGIMIFWPLSLRRFLPPPLAALVVGTLLGLLFLTKAPVLGPTPMGLPTLHLPFLGLGDLTSIIQPAFVLALLGSIDSLLTSLVADSITRTQHNSNRELIGQGIGNMVAGLLGALPGAGATMRTVVNVRAGGRTFVSGVVHALILLTLVLGLGHVTEHIPHAVLAGILMKVGWDIIDWGYLKHIHRAPREKVIVMFITLGLTVFVDLITAVAVGLILAAFVTARWMETEELKGIQSLAIPESAQSDDGGQKQDLTDQDEDILIIAMRGRFSYASAREITKRVGTMVTDYKALILDFSEAAQIDTSAAMAISDMLQATDEQDIVCILSGLTGQAEQTLHSLGVAALVTEDRIINRQDEAVGHARELIMS